MSMKVKSECDDSTSDKSAIDDQLSPTLNWSSPIPLSPLSVGSLSQDQYNDHTVREQLRLLIHVIKCGYAEPKGTDEVACTNLKCKNMKTVLNHIGNHCVAGANCDYKSPMDTSCKQTRHILSHWRQCSDPNCKTCAADDIKELSKTIDKQILFAKIKMNRGRPVKKIKHISVSKELRDHSVLELMNVIFSIVDSTLIFQKKYENFQKLARELEANAFQHSTSMNEYKKSIDDKILIIKNNQSAGIDKFRNNGKNNNNNNNNNVNEVIQQQPVKPTEMNVKVIHLPQVKNNNWTNSMKPELRKQFISDIVDAKFQFTCWNSGTREISEVGRFFKNVEKLENELFSKANSRTEYYTLMTEQIATIEKETVKNNREVKPHVPQNIPKSLIAPLPMSRYIPQNFPNHQNNLPQNPHYPVPNVTMAMNPHQIMPRPQMRSTQLHQPRPKMNRSQPIRMMNHIPVPYEYTQVMPLNNLQQNMVPQFNIRHHAGSMVYHSAAPMNWPHQSHQPEYPEQGLKRKKPMPITIPNVSIESQTKRLKQTDQKENVIDISGDSVEDKKFSDLDLDLWLSDQSNEVSNLELQKFVAELADSLTPEMNKELFLMSDSYNNNNNIVNNNVNNNNNNTTTSLLLNELSKPIDQQHSPAVYSPNDGSICSPKSHTSVDQHQQQSGNPSQCVFNHQEVSLQSPHDQLSQFQQQQQQQQPPNQFPQFQQQQQQPHNQLSQFQQPKQQLQIQLSQFQQQQLQQQHQEEELQRKLLQEPKLQRIYKIREALLPETIPYMQFQQQQQQVHHHQQQQLHQQQQQQQEQQQQQQHQQQQKSPQQQQQHYQQQQQQPQLQFQNQMNYSPTYPGQSSPVVNSPIMILSPSGQDIRSPVHQLSPPESQHHDEKPVNFLQPQIGKCGQRFPTFPNVPIN